MSPTLLPLLLAALPRLGSEPDLLPPTPEPPPVTAGARLVQDSAPPPGGFFLGLAGGYANSLANGDDIDDDLNLGFNTNTDLDSTVFGWKVYGGYRFPRTPVSVELSYVDLGDLEAEIRAAPPSLPPFQNLIEEHYPGSGQGVSLCGRLSFDFLERLSLSAKGGGWWWRSSAEFTTIQPPGGTQTTEKVEESGVDLIAGLGFDMRIVGGLHARLEFERYFFPRRDTDFLSAGLFYSFGGRPPRAAPAIR